MKYIITLINGEKYTITQDEYQNLEGKTGLIFIPSINVTINMVSIASIHPEGQEEDEKNHTIGVLHDGSRVIRQFDQWYCLTGEANEKGNYSVRPDPQYYPEVAMDCVPSVKVFERKYQALPLEERKKAICSGREPRRYLGTTTPTSIAEIVKDESEWCIKHD
jgi:hypothetical protein